MRRIGHLVMGLAWAIVAVGCVMVLADLNTGLWGLLLIFAAMVAVISMVESLRTRS